MSGRWGVGQVGQFWGGSGSWEGNVEVERGYGVGVRVSVAVEELGGGEVSVGPVGVLEGCAHSGGLGVAVEGII